jgi:hypothetical protein
MRLLRHRATCWVLGHQWLTVRLAETRNSELVHVVDETRCARCDKVQRTSRTDLTLAQLRDSIEREQRYRKDHPTQD